MTILLAEDDEHLSSLAVKVLTREGYTVLVAKDGQEAMRIFEREAPRITLALVDDVMPLMGGRAVLAMIREVSPALPAILCAGYEWQLDGIGVRGMGYQVLHKPWESRELLLLVQQCLEPPR